MEKQPPTNPDFNNAPPPPYPAEGTSSAPPPYYGGGGVQHESYQQGAPGPAPYPTQPQPYPYPQPPYPAPNQGYSMPPPQQTGYPVMQQPRNTVIITAPQVMGPYPVNMTCTKCHAQIVSEVRYESGLLTWLICGGLALVGCWIGCCLIPFCIDECSDVTHRCPNCKQFIGQYRRL